MKHLKRIFESTEELDTDYIEMCFVDFIDSGSIFDIIKGPNSEYDEDYIQLWFETPFISGYGSNRGIDIDNYISSLKRCEEFYLNIKNSLDKVKIKYPNIKTSLYDETSLVITLKL
jgi:hypothetical protein